MPVVGFQERSPFWHVALAVFISWTYNIGLGRMIAVAVQMPIKRNSGFAQKLWLAVFV